MSINYKGWDTQYDITFELSTYREGGGLAVLMNYYDKEFKCNMSYGTLTVNLEDFPTYGSKAFVDINNLGEGIIQWIEDNNLGKQTSRLGFSGFCVYPEVDFNLDEINKHLTKEN